MEGLPQRPTDVTMDAWTCTRRFVGRVPRERRVGERCGGLKERGRKERIGKNGRTRAVGHTDGTTRDLLQNTKSQVVQPGTLPPYMPVKQELHPFQWTAAITLVFSPYILLMLLPRHIMRISSPEKVQISTEILYKKLAKKGWFVFENMLEKQFQLKSMQEGKRILEYVRDRRSNNWLWKPRIQSPSTNEHILVFNDVEIFLERMDRVHHKDWIVVMEVRIFGGPSDPDVLRTIHAVEWAYDSLRHKQSRRVPTL